MENNNQTSLNRILGLVAVIIGLLLIIGLGYYSYTHLNKQTTDEGSVDNSLQEEAALSARSLDMAAASAMYAELAETETDPAKRARYAILQGFTSNNAGNYEVGIPLLKGVIADPAVSGSLKSEALIALLQLGFKPNSFEPLRMIFDDGGIYAEAMSGGDLNNANDLRLASSKLYGIADAYHQYAISHYARAFTAGQYILSNPDISTAEREEGLALIKSFIETGDTLMNVELASGLYQEDTTNVVRDLLFMSMHMKLFALEVSAREDESMRTKADTYYAYLLTAFSETVNVPATWSIENYARFYYAAYLADVYGTERASDIHDALLPLQVETGDRAVSNAYSVWPFLETALKNSDEYATSVNMILSLSEIDSDFRVFLERKGWIASE